jgi:hypothetical protein
LTDDTQQVITRSAVCSALDPLNPNLRTSFGVGETNGEPIFLSLTLLHLISNFPTSVPINLSA